MIVKCKWAQPGFVLGSWCPFPTTINISPQVHIYIYISAETFKMGLHIGTSVGTHESDEVRGYSVFFPESTE